MQIKWRGEVLVLIVMVSLLVYLPVLLDDVALSSRGITWFIIGWTAVRASALLVTSRRKGAPRDRR